MVSALMLIYFVSLVNIYLETGLDKLLELPKETLDSVLEARQNEIKSIMETQFALAYYANVSKQDSDNMTPTELDNWHKILVERKTKETELEEK